MVSSVAVLGPFSGGLNTASDASAISDNELSEAVNVNVDYDGSLVCRTPISQVPCWLDTANTPSGNQVNISGRILVLGTYVIGQIPYLMASTPQGIIAGKVTVRNGVEWLDYVVVSTSVFSDCVIQLHNCVYIVAHPQSAGGNIIWDGNTVTVDSDGPRGSAGVFFKGRVWIVPGALPYTYPLTSQLRFSDPVSLVGTPNPVWSAPNIIPVGQGDGQNLIDLLIVNDNLMLFKNNSTYMFMFDVSPNEGILRKINNNIGVSAQFCALTHENEAYVYHEGKVYQIINNAFIETSIKISFKQPLIDEENREKVCLSLLDNTIVFRYFSSLYSLNLTTKTWTEWKSSNSTLNSIGRIVKLETNTINNKLETYYAGSINLSNNALMAIKTKHTSSDEERVINTLSISPNFAVTFTSVPIECRVTTKIFDFGTPHLFKRLMWWGVDMIGDGRIIALSKPARQTLPVTWNALSSFRWDQLYTWDRLLEETATTTTDYNDPYVIRRKFIKLLKSLRFRRISFSIRFFSNGKTSSEQTLGPSRIFSISAIVGAKQTVVKQVE